MEKSIIPQNYDEWHHCIVVDCGLQLTETYIAERISSLQNPEDYYTQQFVKLYGQQHLENVLSWFVQAQNNQ